MNSATPFHVDYYLPDGERWFNYDSKSEEFLQVGKWNYFNLSDLEQGIFVKGGTILPLLEHDGCMALLACITNSIQLEVYLDKEFASTGEMYVDDGETFDFKKG